MACWMRLAAAAPRGFVDRATRRSGSKREVDDDTAADGDEDVDATAAMPADGGCSSDQCRAVWEMVGMKVEMMPVSEVE